MPRVVGINMGLHDSLHLSTPDFGMLAGIFFDRQHGHERPPSTPTPLVVFKGRRLSALWVGSLTRYCASRDFHRGRQGP